MKLSAGILDSHQIYYDQIGNAQARPQWYLRSLLSYTPDWESFPMDNVVPSEQNASVANQFYDDACGLEYIVSPTKESKIATRGALSSLRATLGVRYQSDGLSVPGTPVQII